MLTQQKGEGIFYILQTNHFPRFYRRETMNNQTLKSLFTDEVLSELFPAERTNEFFEALFGDANEGAYDIKLRYYGYEKSTKILQLNLDLQERPGSCLVCSLTYGLPEVFSRHPIINVKGLVSAIEKRLEGIATCADWKLGTTEQQEKSRHSIPLQITLVETA
jgi:hypothetical protein